MVAIRHLIATGLVQGVGYRAFVADQAATFGLEGWVRNRRDGTVEAVAAGRPDAVAHFIGACRRGPPGAHVKSLDLRDGSAEDLMLRRGGEPFSVLPTA